MRTSGAEAWTTSYHSDAVAGPSARLAEPLHVARGLEPHRWTFGLWLCSVLSI